MGRYPMDTGWLNRYRTLILRCWSHEEIAIEMGITVSALRQRLYRARRRGDVRAIYPKHANSRRILDAQHC